MIRLDRISDSYVELNNYVSCGNCNMNAALGMALLMPVESTPALDSDSAHNF